MKDANMKLCLSMAIVCATIIQRTFGAVSIPAATLVCTNIDVKYDVTGGNVGGLTYVETTTTCPPINLTGAATQTVTVNFVTCGVTVNEVTPEVLTFIIVVQQASLYSAQTDSRYQVTCSKTVGQTPATSNSQVVPADPTGSGSESPGGALSSTISTVPQMALYKVVNGTKGARIATSNTLSVGDDVIMEITLSPHQKGFDMVVNKCIMTAKTATTNVELAVLELTDASGPPGCPKFSFFPNFTYSTTTVPSTSDPNVTFNVDWAHLTTEVVMPTVTRINFSSGVKVSLYYTCYVQVCAEGNAQCVAPNCPSVGRKRRQSDVTNDNVSITEVTSGFQVTQNSAITAVESGETDVVCLKKSDFWISLIFMILLLIAAFVATCCFVVCSRRNRRRKETKLVDDETSNSEISRVSPTGKSTGSLFFLPRFVPMSLNFK